MWLTSNKPTAFRTVWCSSTRPEYWTGMSHPPKSTILAPRERCMGLSGVDLSGAGDDMGKGQNNRGWKGVSITERSPAYDATDKTYSIRRRQPWLPPLIGTCPALNAKARR